MKKILLNSLNELLYIENEITSIEIESPIIYRNIAYNLRNEIVLSEEDNILDIDKYGLIIYNPFDLNINDPRLIKLMYKKLDKYRTEEYNIRIASVNEEIKKIVYDLSLNLDVAVEVGADIDFQKLLTSINLKFVDPTFESFIEMFIKYLKIYLMFTSTKVIFTFGLISLFSKEELDELVKEISLLDVNIVDFKIQQNNIKSSIIIDKDWCII